MRLIIGFLLYWFSMNGYYLLMVSKFKVKKEFVFAISASLLIIILFFASILNMLFAFSILILFGGFFTYLYLDRKKLLTKDFLKSFFDYKYFIFMGLILYFTVVGYQLHLTHYDNFSHWALAIKQLFNHNTLSSFKYNIDTFTSYPPGSALFTYYFGLIFSETEEAMIIGHNYLNLAFMSPILALFNDKKKVSSSILFCLLVLCFSIININFNDLLVDTTLGLVGITSFIYAFVNRDDYKKCFKGLTLFSILFVLIKNSGFIFMALNGFLLYLVFKHNGKVKEGIKYIGLMFLITIGIFLIWQSHLGMVYPSDDGYTSRHSVSINNVGRNVLQKGFDKIIEILKIYFNYFIDIKNNVINHYLIIFNLFLVFMAFFYKKNRSVIKKSLLLFNGIFLLYGLALGVMYIVSMPYDEALYLAGFNRYMMTMIIALMAIIIIIVYYHLDNGRKGNVGILITFMIFLGMVILNNDYQYFIGKDGYQDSLIKDALAIKENIDISDYQEHSKVFYLKNKSSCSFYKYAFKYAYFESNINVVCDKIDVDKYNDNTLIVVENKNGDNHELKGLKKLNDHIYLIDR